MLLSFVRRLKMLTTLGFLAVLVGCSPTSEKVKGTVTFDGKPLAEGNIQFIPAPNSAQKSTEAAAIRNGTFEFASDPGLQPGEYQVSILASNSANVSDELPGKARVETQLIPARYNKETTLKAEVKKGGDNSFTFKLEK